MSASGLFHLHVDTYYVLICAINDDDDDDELQNKYPRYSLGGVSGNENDAVVALAVSTLTAAVLPRWWVETAGNTARAVFGSVLAYYRCNGYYKEQKNPDLLLHRHHYCESN